MLNLGQAHFWPKGHNLNKLGRGPLDGATYQISRLYALWFQTRRFLKFSSWKSIFSLCDLDMKRTITIWTVIKDDHIRLIPAKFGKNPDGSLGGDVLWSNCWYQTSNNHNIYSRRKKQMTLLQHKDIGRVGVTSIYFEIQIFGTHF